MHRRAFACMLVVSMTGAIGAFGTAPGRATAPQSPAQIPGAFRSAITLVPVDVRVLDREGRPVTDLKQDDFTILEDGVRQEIAHFEARTLTPHTPSPDELAPALRRAPSYDIAAQDHRIFLIVLGRGRLREPSDALNGLMHFVRDRLLPQDQVAVLAWNRATDFTTDHEKIVQVLQRFDRGHEAIEGKLAFHFSSLAAAYGSKKIPAHIQGDIDAVFQLSTREAARTEPPIPSRQVVPGGVAESRRMQQETARVVGDLLTSSSAMSDLPFEEFVSENARTMQDLGNVYAGIQYLRYLDGEKHLVLVTEKGLFLPREEDDKRIAEAAAAARVVVDTVETGGLYVGINPALRGPTPGQWSQFWAFQTLRTIADLTGGNSSICEYTRVAVDRIDESTRAAYLLAYYPKSMVWDGRYRKVTVKVDRPDVKLLYRHGYEATDQLVPFDRQSFLTFNRIISAAQYDEDVRDIKVRAKATRERVEVTIDASHLTFTTENGLHVLRLDVAVLPIDAKGRVSDDRWDRIELTLNDEEFARAKREGLLHPVAMTLKPTALEVRVIVYDYAADLLGSTTVRVF